MKKRECLAMILAGGQGSRLGSLTKKLAKPAVPFGGKYRIIDFALSNCTNSGIDTVGVLTQYQPLALHSYIGKGSAWDLDRNDGGVFVLPPYAREDGADWYRGTADAIYQNINFIDMVNPNYVLILSGDHIYTMDYAKMLQSHKEKMADASISVVPVPWQEASRFGIMNVAASGRIQEFQEKPAKPNSNLASMGIYIFNWKILRRVLEEDAASRASSHDFGKDIIPGMLADGCRLTAYQFEGYWKDVGTIESFWQANMDLLADEPELNLYDSDWRIYSVNPTRPPHCVLPGAKVTRSLISEGCTVCGEVDHSVIFPGVHIGEGAKIRNSVIMPYAQIEPYAEINHAIVGRRCVVAAGASVGSPIVKDIVVVGESSVISPEDDLQHVGVIPQKQVV